MGKDKKRTKATFPVFRTSPPWDRAYPHGYKDEPRHPADPDYKLQTTREELAAFLAEHQWALPCYDEMTNLEAADAFLEILHPSLYQNFDEYFRHEPLSNIELNPGPGENGEIHNSTLQELFACYMLPKWDDITIGILYDYSRMLRGTYEWPDIEYEDPIAPILRELNAQDEEKKKRKQEEMLRKVLHPFRRKT